MLGDLISCKEDWKFLLIEDSALISGHDLVKCVITEHVKRNYDISVISYDNPPEFLTEDLNNHSKTTSYDGYSDPFGWKEISRKENFVYMSTDLVKYFEPLLDLEAKEYLIVIDSLSSLIIHQGVNTVCQMVHKLLKLFNDVGKKLHVLGLYHRNIHDRTVALSLESIGSTLNLFSGTNNQLMCDVFHRKNIKTIREKIYYRVTPEFEVEHCVAPIIQQPVELDQPDPTAGLTFKLNLGEKEKAAREELVLPYTKNKGNEIIYEYDSADDFDEEDPDDDLNI